MKVVFCVPVIDRPYDPLIKSLEECLPAVEADGWEHALVHNIGSPYISSSRSEMIKKGIDAKADVLMFLDHDISFPPDSMVKILAIERHVVAGTYRFKQDKIEYMGCLDTDDLDRLIVEPDGCVQANKVPAGFLKVTGNAVRIFARKFPELLYGDPLNPHVDLFNHGAYEGIWWGEDYAFSRRWIETGNKLYILPDINIDHNSKDKVYKGNFHKHLLGLDHEICDSVAAL